MFNDALVNQLISSNIDDNNFPVLTRASPIALGMAIDSEGNLYMGYQILSENHPDIVAKFTSAGGLINDEFDY